MTVGWGKADIVSHLANIHGYTSYLEICTPSTGGSYRDVVERGRLRCRRLMYRYQEDHDDALAVDFTSPSEDIAGCLRQIEADGLRFDVMLVDPWHLYETSLRDLRVTFDLLDDGGTLVVHDCLPPTAEMATLRVRPEAWCGVTYHAYVDFVTGRDDLTYYTVDTDYGCGVIRKGDAAPPMDGETAAILGRWRALGDDLDERFRFFVEHRRPLLKLRSIEEFLAAAPQRWPEPQAT